MFFRDKLFLFSFLIFSTLVVLVYGLPYLPCNQISIKEFKDSLIINLKNANQIYLYETFDKKLTIYRSDLYNEKPLKWWNLIKTMDLKPKTIIVGNEKNNIIDLRGIKTAQVSLFGGDGNDILLGTRNDDIIHGENGNDLIAGCFGSDNIYGESGDDIIFGDDIDQDEQIGFGPNDKDYFGSCNLRFLNTKISSNNEWYAKIQNNSDIKIKMVKAKEALAKVAELNKGFEKQPVSGSKEVLGRIGEYNITIEEKDSKEHPGSREAFVTIAKDEKEAKLLNELTEIILPQIKNKEQVQSNNLKLRRKVDINIKH